MLNWQRTVARYGKEVYMTVQRHRGSKLATVKVITVTPTVM